MARPEDWLKSSRKQRKDMYQTVRQLVRLGALTWDEFYKRALERVVSDSFNENFRQGRISGKDAVRVYRFLQDHYRESAQALDAEAFAGRKLNDFLLRYRRLGLVHLLPELYDVPFRTNRLGPEWAEYPFKADESLRFRLRLPLIYGCAMVLHGCEAGWFSLPLEMPTDHECVDLRSPWFTYKPHAFIKPVRPGAQTVCAPVRSKTDVQRRVGSNVFLFVLEHSAGELNRK